MSQNSERLREQIIDAIRLLPPDKLVRLAEMIERIKQAPGETQRRLERPTLHSISRDWPHAPVHRISEHGTYLVTAGTLHKQHYFRGPERLDELEEKLLHWAQKHHWHLEAWAVFSNHYHFIAHSQSGSEPLNSFLRDLHADTALFINRLDGATGRQVWHNFWETQLTYERSYLARLNYVHQNAVRHGLVLVANQYRWCSAAWFERTATPAQVKTIYSFKTDRIRVLDDFEVC